MDVVRAFTFPFDDEDWPTKTVVGALMMLAAFLPFVPLGYQAQVARNVLRGKKHPLPGAAQIGQTLSDGLIVFIAWVLYNLPLILLGCLLAFFGAVLGESDLGMLLFLCLSLCLGGFLLLFLVIATMFFSMGMIRYAETGNFTAFIAIRDLWDDVREHTMLLFELTLYQIGLMLLGSTLMGVLAITCVGALLVIFMWQVAAGHLIGQAAQQVVRSG